MAWRHRAKSNEDDHPHRESGFRAATRSIRRFLTRFGRWVGVAFLALASVMSYLVHFHIWPEKWRLVPEEQLPAFAFIVGLMFILSEQVNEYNDEIASIAKTLDARVTSLDQDISNLASQVTPQLTLHQCVERLQSILNSVPGGSLLTIHHIALDMQTAWLHMQDKIFDFQRTAQRNKIRYQLLIVSGDGAKPTNEPSQLQEEMTQMRERARSRLAVIKEYFDSAKGALNLVDVEIRAYTSLPVVHGIFADKPTPVHFVTFSGWRGSAHSNYHWGEGHYYEIKGSPEASTSMGDLVSLFDGYFENLWKTGKPVYQKDSAVVSQGGYS
jgi:hypothetical protein